MKIKNKILLEVSESDLINGVFENNEIVEIADNCFYNMSSLKKVVAPKVKKIGSDCLSYNASLTSVTLPNATTFGSDCLCSNASLTSVTLPNATTFGSYCLRSNDKLTSVTLPNATTFGSYCLSSNDKLTSVTLPNATTFGSYCLSSNASLTSVTLPNATTFGSDCLSSNASLTSVKTKKYDLKTINVDNSCFVIEAEKTSKGVKIYSGYNFVSMQKNKIEKEECFVASKDKFFAHGTTVKKAISDLQFKIIADKLKNEPIKKDTMFTVKYYRLLTGACDLGVRSFMQANKIPFKVLNEGKSNEETVELKPIKAVDVLPLLEKNNAWGFEKVKKLVDF